jgi:hypothetical protein
MAIGSFDLSLSFFSSYSVSVKGDSYPELLRTVHQ